MMQALLTMHFIKHQYVRVHINLEWHSGVGRTKTKKAGLRARMWVASGLRWTSACAHRCISDADEDEVEDAIVDVYVDGQAEAATRRLEHALEQAGNCTAGVDQQLRSAWRAQKAARCGALRAHTQA